MQRLVFLALVLITSSLLLCCQAFAQTPAQNAPVQGEETTKSAAADKDEPKSEKTAVETAKSDEAKPQEANATKSDDKDTKTEDADEDKADADEKAEDTASKAKKETKKKPKPHKVKTDKLKIEVSLDGTFVADEMEEVSLRPEVWTRFKVLEAVEHGTKVKKGDVLVRFDDEDLEKDLAEEALDQSIGNLALRQEEEEFPRVKKLLELSFESAERRYEQSKADYKYYQEIDRPITVRIVHFRYKSAQEQLASAEEELKQLQQMYEADELTEETEEIVLRRQQFAVETAKLVLELNEESRDYTLNVSLPRNDQFYETSLKESELSYQQAKTALEMGSTRRSYEMEKKREARAKSVERHGKLLSDKGLMVLRAPCDGIVYYGQCKNGKWAQISTLAAKLKPFGTVPANTVLMTVVKPGAMHIESSIGEKDLPDVTAGLETTVIPTADTELELKGKVASVEGVPGASNKFQVLLDFDATAAPKWLVAGMTCDAKVVTYENNEAIVIPQDMVQTDEDNDKIKYVMLVPKAEEGMEADEAVRRNVKLGRKKGKIVEVLKGLEAGDEIIKEEKKDDQD